MPLMMTRIRLDKGSSVASRLKDYCKRAKYQPPTFSLFSDRRGIPVPFLCLHAPCIACPLHDIGPPLPSSPSPFCNISCCVSRHERVELMLSSPTFVFFKFDSWWY